MHMVPLFSLEVEKKKRGASVSTGCQDETFMLKHAFFTFMHAECIPASAESAHALPLATFDTFLFAFLFPSLHFSFPFNSVPWPPVFRMHNCRRCAFTGHLTLRAILNRRSGILWLITLTGGSVCTAACQGSWLEAGTGSNRCGKGEGEKSERGRAKKREERRGEGDKGLVERRCGRSGSKGQSVGEWGGCWG